MRQAAIALAVILLLAFPCAGAEPEALDYLGFSETAENFPQLSSWPSAPDPVVRRAQPFAPEVHLTCAAPRAFAVRFGFYTPSPLFCSPTRRGDRLVPGVSGESCAVLGSYLDFSQCLPLRYSPQSDSLWAEHGGSWYQLCWNPRLFQYEMQPQESAPAPESLCQALVQLSTSQDGAQFSPVSYHITEVKSQSLECGSGDFCYYFCEAVLPAPANFVRISVNDCRSYPLSGGGTLGNETPNTVYLGQVTIECEKAPDPGEGETPGKPEEPGEPDPPDEGDPPGQPDDTEKPGEPTPPDTPEPPDEGTPPGATENPDNPENPGQDDPPAGPNPPGQDNPEPSLPDNPPPTPPAGSQQPSTPPVPVDPPVPEQPDTPSGPVDSWEPDDREEAAPPKEESALRLRRTTPTAHIPGTDTPAEDASPPPASQSLPATQAETGPVFTPDPQLLQEQVMIEYRERPVSTPREEPGSLPTQPAEALPVAGSGENHIFYQKGSSGSGGMSLSSVLLAAGLGVQLHMVASRLSSRRRDDAPSGSGPNPPQR